MARIRTIKPEFPLSESVGRLSRDARLLFIQLWLLCDDSGRTRGPSRILASLLYPFDDDALGLMDAWLGELVREEMVCRYEHDGNTYLQVCKWLKHQKIDKPSPSRIPEFGESSRILATDLVPRTLDLVPRTEEQGTLIEVGKTEIQTSPIEQSKAEIIERVFTYYCSMTKRSPSQYTLTSARRSKAMSRLNEQIKSHRGELEAAESDLMQAVTNLAQSEWHVQKGVLDWTKQIFTSAEEFQERLVRRSPVGAKNAKHATRGEVVIGTTDIALAELLGEQDGMAVPAFQRGYALEAGSDPRYVHD